MLLLLQLLLLLLLLLLLVQLQLLMVLHAAPAAGVVAAPAAVWSLPAAADWPYSIAKMEETPLIDRVNDLGLQGLSSPPGCVLEGKAP